MSDVHLGTALVGQARGEFSKDMSLARCCTQTARKSGGQFLLVSVTFIQVPTTIIIILARGARNQKEVSSIYRDLILLAMRSWAGERPSENLWQNWGVYNLSPKQHYLGSWRF